MDRVFTGRVGFSPSARLQVPTPPVLPSSGLRPGELYWNAASNLLAVARTSTVLDTVVLEIGSSVGSGVSLTGSNGRYAFSADNTVLRTTSSPNLAGLLTFTVDGVIDASIGKIRVPQGTSFPVTGNLEGHLFWHTDDAKLYVYDASAAAFITAAAAVASVAAGAGLTGGGSGAVTLTVGTGDGILVGSDTVGVRLATDPALEFATGALRVFVDTTSTGAIASALARTSAGLGLRVDNVTTEVSAAGGLLRLKAGGIGDTHLSSGAKQGVLESKTTAGFQLVSGQAIASGVSVLDVTTIVRSTATTPTPTTTLSSTLGVYVGWSPVSRLRVRDTSTRNAFFFPGTDAEVYGRLSSRGVFSGSMTGIEVVAMGAGVPNSGTLAYTAVGTLLSWNGGTGVDIVTSGSATGYYRIEGSGADDYIHVRVTESLLAGNASSSFVPVRYYPTAQPVNVTGVVVNGMAPGVPASGTLSFTSSGQTLAWDGGSAVAVGAGGTFLLTGSGGGSNRIRVKVTSGSLPGANQSDSLSRGDYFELVLSAFVLGLERPYFIDSATSLDFYFIEVFNYYSVPLSSALVQASFTDVIAPVAAYETTFAKLHVHPQVSPLATWTITHNLGTTNILFDVYDDQDPRGEVIWDDVDFPDENTMTLDFSSAQAGLAFLIGRREA